MSDRTTLILYHANCHDGFGGAFAAWNKFGDQARYIATEQHSPLPHAIDGADVTLIDFCFPPEVMRDLTQRAASVMVLDHHISNKEFVTGNPDWQFSDEHSGCVLAWHHFHPNTPTPLFLQFVEAADLWRHTLPDSKIIQRWIHAQPMTFPGWDGFVRDFENPKRLAAITEKAHAYEEHFQSLVNMFESQAQLVQFEGHRVLAVQAPRFLRSELGHRLALKQPPFGIVWCYQDNGIRFSLRGDGSIDVSELAIRHGSGGHHNAAGFFVAHTLPLPFTIIHE